tara:strand:+ start:26187 stop:26333 length:147 start_codon:yes stop_codon:yes gene_type:complete
MQTFKLIWSGTSFFCLVTILSARVFAVKPILQCPQKAQGQIEGVIREA